MKNLFQRLSDAVFGEAVETNAAPRATASSELERKVMALVVPSATKADRAKVRRVVRLLEKSPTATMDLEFLVHHLVQLSFDTTDAGAGAYRRSENTVFLSRMRSDAGTVATLAHELTHAYEYFAGRGGNIHTQGREAYASAIVREESKTYFHETVVGRELVHALCKSGSEVWTQLLTDHPLQMWFQLVHGVRYKVRPTPKVLEADAALTGKALEAAQLEVFPYFERYARAYYAYELTRWDMHHGRRPWLPRHEMGELLGAAFEMLPREDRLPMRGGGR